MPSLLGSPALEFKSLDGREALGELFEYTVRLQTPDSPALTEYITAIVRIANAYDAAWWAAKEWDYPTKEQQ
jgi:hypothetical protein